MLNTELNSPAMDEESTQAAEPVLDAAEPVLDATEPVLDATEPAPSADETQSIYAWSQDGDETLVMQRRSWKFPVALASLAAVAAVTTGVIMLWPANKPAPPAQTSKVAVPAPMPSKPAPSAPAPTASPGLTLSDTDWYYIDLLRSNGVTGDPAALLTIGHAICHGLADGTPADVPIQSIARSNPQLGLAGARAEVSAATTAYCPQYAVSQ